MFVVVSGRARLFTFGCSFTDYVWAMWPQVLARQYDVPLYNYGKAGAGNMYMFNHIMQADCYYNFQPEDIIAVCWTNVCREDRYVDRQWYTAGNIFTNNQFEVDWVKQWVDPTGMAIRDYAAIKGAQEFIASRTKNHLFLSMCDIVTRTDQWSSSKAKPNPASSLYQSTLTDIKPSFYDILWQDDNMVKQKKDAKIVHKRFIDGHPSPAEALEYLEAVTDIDFDTATRDAVQKSQLFWRDFCAENASGSSQQIFRPSEMTEEQIDNLTRGTQIWPQEKVMRL